MVVEQTHKIVNRLGLHVRPVTALAETAKQFSADVKISANGRTVSAKAVMDLLTLGAEAGTELNVRAEGDDAEDAVEAIGLLISEGFGEL